MDYCRKVSPLEGSKNRDSLFKKLVRPCVCVCVCVGGGGGAGDWLCVCVWLRCVEKVRGSMWCVFKGAAMSR